MKSLTWEFPLHRTHAGILLGNGVQGLMVWGHTALHITVGRAGFWDHRGGNVFASKTTYRQLRGLLEAGDEQKIKDIFAPPDKRPGRPDRPHQIGGGRLELTFSDGLVPAEGTLDLSSAVLTVTLRNAAGREERLTIRQSMDQELAWVDLPPALRGQVKVHLVPTWKYVAAQLEKVGVRPPETWSDADGGGFCQKLPEDPALALAWAHRGDQITLATALGATVEDNPADAAKRLSRHADLAVAAQHADEWWKQYQRDVPRLNLPDPVLQRAYDYGVYKQAGLSTPGGVAASLQGPWLEEYQLPPWSCDYHFNINVQMIYWPALATGRLSHFDPLWAMIKGWMPQLRQNAEGFFGVKDALMLPHAVDDRCMAVGQFWTGTIDHACTAWMAQMAWQHYRYAMDEKILREIAWPLLLGAFNGYWAMLEELDEGGQKRLSLPVSVSPEYNGSNMTAWGRDASFQLAALHCVADILPKAAAILGEKIDPRWERVAKELPPYATVPAIRPHNIVPLVSAEKDSPAFQKAYTQAHDTAPGRWGEESRPGPRIALWQGKDYDVSHRHPSHLGGIYPFCTLDPAAPAHREVVTNSIRHWVKMGPGAWSGWAIPFVALIHNRVGNVEGAIAWLHLWDEVFTNEGHGTLHDAFFPGVSTITASSDVAQQEIMQMDAGMGAITAILELLVHSRGDQIVVLPRIPRRWRRFGFDGIRTEGAFLVGATVEGGQTQEVRITSLAGGLLRLAHHLGDRWTIDGKAATGPTLSLETTKGQKITLRRA